MFCEKCGFELTAENNFRPNCGAKIQNQHTEHESLPNGIGFDENGSLTWIYRKNFFRHPEDLTLVAKVCLGMFIFISVFVAE